LGQPQIGKSGRRTGDAPSGEVVGRPGRSAGSWAGCPTTRSVVGRPVRSAGARGPWQGTWQVISQPRRQRGRRICYLESKRAIRSPGRPESPRFVDLVAACGAVSGCKSISYVRFSLHPVASVPSGAGKSSQSRSGRVEAKAGQRRPIVRHRICVRSY
jgi:hypothetical protein